MQQLGEQLIIRGYPPQLVAMPPLYDAVKRRLCLQKAFSDIVVRRSSEHEDSRVFSDSIVLVLPYSAAYKGLRIKYRMKNLIKTLELNTDAVLAFSVSNSLFLKTYPHNTPIQFCRRVRG